ALMALGAPGGIMDANDDLAAGPEALITDPNLSLINRNNPTHTAGVTFFGQFIDHDMTFDQRSRLGFPTQPIITQNARTCFFDLDSVYAGGTGGNPELYDPADPIKFLVENGGQFEDLPRDPINHVAILGDPRNDENMMIAGMHAAFLLHDFRSGRGRQPRPSGLARRRQSAEALYRVANVLRLRRRLQCRCQAEQNNRHDSLHTTLPPSAGNDFQRDAARFAHAAEFIEMHNMNASIRSAHRARDG